MQVSYICNSKLSHNVICSGEQKIDGYCWNCNQKKCQKFNPYCSDECQKKHKRNCPKCNGTIEPYKSACKNWHILYICFECECKDINAYR